MRKLPGPIAARADEEDFGAVNQRTAAPANATPPTMKPTVEIFPAVVAEFQSSVPACVGHRKLYVAAGHASSALFEDEIAIAPAIEPTARPTTPTAPTAIAIVFCEDF